MYRPVQQQQGNPSVKTVFFSDKNYNTLQTVLLQDFEQRNNAPLNDQQLHRLSKTLDHYLTQVYQVQGDKPIQSLNKEVLSACAKDFSQYMQRKEITKGSSPVKNVMDDKLFQDTSQRFERLTQERNEVKALPPPMPDFRISLDEDGPAAAEMYEKAKKLREIEALRSTQQANEMLKAEAGLQSRITADAMFKNQQDMQNRNTELALVQRQQSFTPSGVSQDMSLAIMPDRRDLLLAPVGSFDTMTGSPPPRSLGQANAGTTIVQPELASPVKNNLPQNYVVREDKIVSYREFENNLFIYSADRNWLKNTKENRYNFTVNFDGGDKFGHTFAPSLTTENKFRNIVRIELVKCIMPGESLDVTIENTYTTEQTNITSTTNYQDNILNLPYINVLIPELENNNYGTDNYLDRSFGILQYDAQWLSDTTQGNCTKGYLAMIPKFLKCQKEYYPTPLSTLQKMTISFRRPNGELLSETPDTFDIGGIVSTLSPPGPGSGIVFPYNIDLNGSSYASVDSTGAPYNFFINTSTFFSKFEICKGDRIQMNGYTFPDSVLNDPTYGSIIRDFTSWINREEGHIVVGTAYYNTTTSTMVDGANSVGYSNFIVIQARYQNPSSGSTALSTFAPANLISFVLNTFGQYLESPCRLINLNRQLNLVFRVITRQMDSLPQIRPDNNY